MTGKLGGVQPGPHVLLVEDGPTTARATARLLTDGRLAAVVTIAGGVGEATEALAADRVDLVVLDLALPLRGGLDLLADLRASPAGRQLPVVMLSGTADPEIVQRSFDLGANCFVRKPHQVADLIPAIRAIEHFWERHTSGGTAAAQDSVFQLPLAPTADAVREARRTVRRLLVGWDLGAVAELAELCTSELATNAVIHARTPVLLVVSLGPDVVRVEVEDATPGTLEVGSLVQDSETGRGLAIVNAMTESWGVEQTPGGKTVWFELRRPDAAIEV